MSWLLLVILVFVTAQVQAVEGDLLQSGREYQCASLMRMTVHELDEWIFERELRLHKLYGFHIVVAPVAIASLARDILRIVSLLAALRLSTNNSALRFALFN